MNELFTAEREGTRIALTDALVRRALGGKAESEEPLTSATPRGQGRYCRTIEIPEEKFDVIIGLASRYQYTSGPTSAE